MHRPVCKTADVKEYSTGTEARRFDCRRCGEFDLSGTVMAVLQPALDLGLHRRALMSHTIRRMIGFGSAKPPLVVTDKLETYWTGEKLPTPSRQADELILLAGDKQMSPEEPLRVGADFLGAWLGTTTGRDSGVDWILDHLNSEGLAGGGRYDAGEGTFYAVQLKMRGWERYAELKRAQVNSRTAFMAMKFGDAVFDKVVDECFRPAVRRAGFELKKLTDEQPAGLIDDQIRAALLSGRFVIADLTHGSHGAYWEAGFAEGLRLPVIYTCEASAWKEKQTHFDTNHMVTIIWDPAKLKKAGDELTATIRATLRAEAKQEDQA